MVCVDEAHDTFAALVNTASTEPPKHRLQTSHSREKELSTTAVHMPEPEVTSSSGAPPTKPRVRRVAAINAEEFAEGQCSSGDPRPLKTPRHDAQNGQDDDHIVVAARRVSKHVYKQLLPQLPQGVTDAQLAREAHGMKQRACVCNFLHHHTYAMAACVRALAALGDGAEEELVPEGAAASILWLRVQNVCRDAVAEAQHALGADNDACEPENGAAFGYVVCFAQAPA